MRIKINNSNITCEEALIKLHSLYTGMTDPNTGEVLPDYDWRADARNWPYEILWQKVVELVFNQRMFIPWKEIWNGNIWSQETVRRRMQEFHQQGKFVPTEGPMKRRRERRREGFKSLTRVDKDE